uniref:Uncharacterized protein n=1 Tax=Nelumbo nucifera TaxID=4432 RepID=A0A822YNP9_NELNU|nr:TPA_asm: hypothetical protein HUJ06_004787 [Nelumbo nucifera]
MAAGRGSALSNLNLNVLVGAPCSVGILVDHDYRRPAMLSQHFSCVSITVIRLRLSNDSDDSDDYEVEKKIDESVLLEFQFKSMNKQSVLYHESVVADEGHVLPLIGSLEDDYDLIMVGRRHRTTMADWRESTELGFLGDKILSSNLVSKIFSTAMRSGEFRSSN